MPNTYLILLVDNYCRNEEGGFIEGDKLNKFSILSYSIVTIGSFFKYPKETKKASASRTVFL